MLQDRFINLAVLNIERDVVNLINNEDILEVYCIVYTVDRKFVLKIIVFFFLIKQKYS
jgi:hypothetical protein